MSQLDGKRRMREDAKEHEEARLRISRDVMECKAGALEEDERLRGRIVERTRGLMSAKKEQGGGDAAWKMIPKPANVDKVAARSTTWTEVTLAPVAVALKVALAAILIPPLLPLPKPKPSRWN